MHKKHKFQPMPMIFGALVLSILALSGCGQKDTTTVPVASPPAADVSPTPAVSTPAPALSQGDMDSHKATLQAQSDYWRKHGQGLNEVPHTKPKQ